MSGASGTTVAYFCHRRVYSDLYFFCSDELKLGQPGAAVED
jgi:hypothetical protein